MTSSVQRRSPRAAPAPFRRRSGRGSTAAPAVATRPLQAPFAAVFGVLVAVVDGYLGWLLWNADRGWGWYLLGPVVLLVGALLGGVLAWRGTGRGSAVLAWACALPLAGLLGLAVFFVVLGTWPAAVGALLLAVAPLVGLVLSRQPAVREWTRPRRNGRLRRRVGAAR